MTEHTPKPVITEDRDLMQEAIGPQNESDRRKVRIDFEAGRATSRSASGLFYLLQLRNVGHEALWLSKAGNAIRKGMEAN